MLLVNSYRQLTFLFATLMFSFCLSLQAEPEDSTATVSAPPSFATILEANKGILYTRAYRGETYAVAIQPSGFGFDLSVFRRDSDGIHELGSSFVGDSDMGRRAGENNDGSFELFSALTTGDLRSKTLSFTIEGNQIVKFKIQGLAERSVHYRRGFGINEDLRHPSPQEQLAGDQSSPSFYSELFSRNEGIIHAESADGRRMTLSIESTRYNGYNIKVRIAGLTDEEPRTGRSYIGPAGSMKPNASNRLNLESQTLTLNIDEGSERGADLELRLDAQGYISDFSVNKGFERSIQPVTCDRVLGRLLFRQPFH